MSIDPVRRRGGPHRHGFSLASILLLTAVLATFSAAVATGMADDHAPSVSTVVGYGIGGSLLGGFVGAGIGLNQPRWLRGVVLGLFSGTISGAMAGVLLAVPKAMPTMCVGAIVIAVLATVVRRWSHNIEDI